MFQENTSLKPFSHYKIGGKARYFFEAYSVGELRAALAEAQKRRLHIFILGFGTNVLFPDRGFPGLVIKIAIDGIERNGNEVTVGAGVGMDVLLEYSVRQSLSGFEWAGGLPGSVGGAIRGNAGCFGGEMKDVTLSIASVHQKTGMVETRQTNECEFSYRSSIFKMHGDEIILSAVFKLVPGDQKLIQNAINEKIAYRKERQPLDYPNVGSIFKNVPLERVPRKHHTLFASAIKTDPIPVIATARLLSEAGLKGVTHGGAMISAKHPNFIVNALGASAHDVKQLILLAKTSVREKFGVDLEEEIEIV